MKLMSIKDLDKGVPIDGTLYLWDGLRGDDGIIDYDPDRILLIRNGYAIEVDRTKIPKTARVVAVKNQ